MNGFKVSDGGSKAITPVPAKSIVWLAWLLPSFSMNVVDYLFLSFIKYVTKYHEQQKKINYYKSKEDLDHLM